MPIVEIEESVLAQLQADLAASKPSKQMLDLVGADPKRRREMLRLFKEAKPDASIPEIDAPAAAMAEVDARLKPLQDGLAALTDKLTKREQQESEAALTGDIEQGRGALRRAGYTAEGITAVEDLMKTRGIADHEAAAALFEKLNPKDEPVLSSDYGTRMVMPFEDTSASDELKKIAGMPGKQALQAVNRWAQSEVRKGLTELRGQR